MTENTIEILTIKDMKTEPNELQIGDRLIADAHFHGLSFIKIERLTPTQIVLEQGTKLRRLFVNRCCAIGSTGWSKTYYRLPTEEDSRTISIQRIAKSLANIKWISIPLETLSKINDLIEEINKEPKL